VQPQAYQHELFSRMRTCVFLRSQDLGGESFSPLEENSGHASWRTEIWVVGVYCTLAVSGEWRGGGVHGEMMRGKQGDDWVRIILAVEFEMEQRASADGLFRSKLEM
jgi:hypothetical protein